jgi:RNB domain
MFAGISSSGTASNSTDFAGGSLSENSINNLAPPLPGAATSATGSPYQHSGSPPGHASGASMSSAASSYPPYSAEIPARVLKLLDRYTEGLKQIVVQGHPWVVNGWARRRIDEDLAAKGTELLEFLELAPNVKNAKRVLEVTGTWPVHTNVEKYIMDLRDTFPPEVLDEAQFLLDNYDAIPDPDERLRRDLRYLGCYAIDKEGAAEIDDALSIEYLDNGREKIWMHIADVSRWIRPGSQLSLEAERRYDLIW